jgi:hypothetical protein
MKFVFVAVGIAALLTPLAVGARTYTLQKGAAITGAIGQTIDTRTTTAGASFSLSVVAPLPNDLLKGAVVYGHVASVQKAGWGTEPHVALSFDRIVFADRHSETIHAQLLQDSPIQDKSGEVTNGAARAVGALVGPAHGVGVAVASKNHKDDISIPQHSTMTIELTEPLKIV